MLPNLLLGRRKTERLQTWLKDWECREILRPYSRFVNVTEYESESTASNHRCTRNGHKPFLEVEKKDGNFRMI